VRPSGVPAWADAHRVEAGRVTADRVVGMGHALAELRSVVGRIARAAGGRPGRARRCPAGS